MTKDQKNQYQTGWLVKEKNSNPDILIDLCEELKNSDLFSGAAKVTITLKGSPDHSFQIQGNLSQVRNDYDELNTKRYFSGSLNINWPKKNNLTVKLSVNFAFQELNLVIQRGNESFVEDIVTTVKNHFKKLKGLSYDDIQDKYKEIDSISEQATEINKIFTESLELKKELDKISKDLKKKGTDASDQQSNIHDIHENSKKIKNDLDNLKKEAKDILSVLNNVKSDVNADRENILKKREEVSGIEEKIRSFFNDIDNNKKKIDEINSESKTIIDTFQKRTGEIISTNEELTNEIKKQLLKATGGRLFGSFEERKSQITTAKWVWAGATCLSLIIQALAIIWLAVEAKEITAASDSFYTDPTFLIKASITLPLFILIGFSAKRYSNERDYEEIYAFKSALSFSLSPYLEIVKETEVDANKEYQGFLLKTISQVFSNPLEKIKDSKSNNSNIDSSHNNSIEDLIKLIEKIRP